VTGWLIVISRSLDFVVQSRQIGMLLGGVGSANALLELSDRPSSVILGAGWQQWRSKVGAAASSLLITACTKRSPYHWRSAGCCHWHPSFRRLVVPQALTYRKGPALNVVGTTV